MEQYREWSKNGLDDAVEPKFPFPPPKVIRQRRDGNEYFECISGNHTLEAAKVAGIQEMSVEIVEGAEKDLIVLAIQDNTRHGRPFTKTEMKDSIFLLRQKGNLTNRKIAEIVGCSKSKVNDVLNEQPGEQDGKRVPKPFDTKAAIKKMWKPFQKHQDSFTEPMVSEFVQGIIALHVIFKQHDLGDDLLEQLKQVFWPDEEENGESEDEDSEEDIPEEDKFDNEDFEGFEDFDPSPSVSSARNTNDGDDDDDDFPYERNTSRDEDDYDDGYDEAVGDWEESEEDFEEGDDEEYDEDFD